MTTWLIGRFQQPRTRDSVDLNGTTDHSTGKLSNSTFVLFVSFVVTLDRGRGRDLLICHKTPTF
ncbi:MAG: hypothetical protein JWP89_3560 [Schlesneria sp.]|nr:hypothetical protein [Schlesneria sp.]